MHGDIEALQDLLKHLGYEKDGLHADGRRLIFVGDLTDRGPDSVAVVRLVKLIVESGVAQCVLGNHELNILLDEKKFDNGWFYGEEFRDQETSEVVAQELADDSIRCEMVDFFLKLPLALQRDDVRVVHACWQSEMVDMASVAEDVIELYKQHRYNINLSLALRTDLKGWQREQRHQNLNPVKVMTSGLEGRSQEPYTASGKFRHLDRYPWWEGHPDEEFCFFGHYSQPYGQSRGQTRAICIDYGVARRSVTEQVAFSGDQVSRNGSCVRQR